MNVCFFGSYERYGYNLLLKKMLEKNQITVNECQSDIKNIIDFFSSHIKLIIKHRKQKYDVMIIPWKGIITLPLAKLLTKKPIVYFPFVSIYQTLVDDRKKYKPNSIYAKIFQFVDKKACQLADLVILDTFEDIQYFCNKYNLNQKKFKRLFLSVDDEKFKPLPQKTDGKFVVTYVGSFVPLHGVNTIIETARKLKNESDIIFVFCGNGQTKENAFNLSRQYNLKNVKFVDYSMLEVLKDSDVGLGIFGKGEKAQSVIPFKIAIVLATKKPLITSDTPAVKEIGLENQKNCLLVTPGDHNELANKILELKEKKELRLNIAKKGYETYREKLLPVKLGKVLKEYLQLM